jgi:formamidopyrimidine-DNA glycosylase
MPELPEVEITARNLRRWSSGRRVLKAEADPAARRIFRPATPRSLAAALAGTRFSEVERVGKHLLLSLRSNRAAVGLWSHLGMTGKWIQRRPGEAPPSHSRARLLLDDRSVLHYQDPRLFGRLRIVPGARFAEMPEIAALGPDPLVQGIDLDRLGRRLARSRRPVKVALLDQSILAGVGNIYASEALFRAGIDPRRPAGALSGPELERLSQAVLAAMRETIAREQSPEVRYVEEPGVENPFQVYARAGERCPRCRKGTLERTVLGQRSTFFCPVCQR